MTTETQAVEPTGESGIARRTLVQGAAWSLPVIAAAVAVPVTAATAPGSTVTLTFDRASHRRLQVRRRHDDLLRRGGPRRHRPRPLPDIIVPPHGGMISITATSARATVTSPAASIFCNVAGHPYAPLPAGVDVADVYCHQGRTWALEVRGTTATSTTSSRAAPTPGRSLL